jgi:hypothetical protein
MDNLNFLLVGLGISVIIYVLYRHTFLKSPKKKMSHKPHFTLKIEPE